MSGRGGGHRPAAARLHDARPQRHVGHHRFGESGSSSADGVGVAVRRAQPHLRRVRVERPLRVAGPGAEAGPHPRPLPLQLSASAGGHFASPLRARPQPLRSLLPLRPRLRRDRRRPRLGHRRARHQLPVGLRSRSSLGRIRELHQLRQMRSGLPDRRSGGEGLCGRGNDQAERPSSAQLAAKREAHP